MEKHISVLDGFTLGDLKLDEGTILEFGNEYYDDDADDFEFTTDVHLNNEEMLNLLNMDDFDDDDNTTDTKNDSSVFYSMSFEKLKAKMTEVSSNGKVLKLLKTEGIGECVPCDAQVTIQYVGYFEFHDEPFDSSFTRGGSDIFRLGRDTLLPGLELAIATMKKHEESFFIIHPDYGYGTLGCPPRIPPNAEIMFCIRMIDFLDNGSADTFENLSREQKKLFKNVVPGVEALLASARQNFRNCKTSFAIKDYNRATMWLENANLENNEDEEQFNQLISQAYSNLAICYNKENKPRRACIACNNVTRPNAKTHFNHGRALAQIGEYKRSLDQLYAALRLAPYNEEIIKEIRMVNEKQLKYLDVEKQLWQNGLNVPREEKTTAFREVARNLCHTFATDDSVLRQPLPEGLTPEEYKDIREQAIAFGLSITQHERRGRTTTFLNKKNY